MIKAMDIVALFQKALAEHWGYIWGQAGSLWTEARQKAATREQTVKYGKKWIGHYVADCSGMFSWAFKKLGGYMYHGSNTMWQGYCTAQGGLKKGKRTDGQELKPGTAVFCCHGTDRTHVGLYVGDGQVIEASGTVNGVIIGKVTNKKWVEWGELKGVQYGMPETTGNQDGRPTLRKGAKGEYVTLLQTMLINRGYSVGSMGADGDFGIRTDSAVRCVFRTVRRNSGRSFSDRRMRNQIGRAHV